MTFTEEQKQALSAKLDKSAVKSRKQGKDQVQYIEGWHAIAEANRIFGYDSWHRETLDVKMVAETPCKIGAGQQWEKDGYNVTYIAKVRITVGDVIREGQGAGHGIDANLGQAHESAIKEAETDAMKRALMTFGNPFGLALYDKDRKNVDDTPPPKANQQKPANNTQNKQAKPAELTPKQKKQKALEWAQGFIRSINEMQKLEMVDAEYKKNIKGIDRLQTEHPDIYQRMLEKYEDRREALAVV